MSVVVRDAALADCAGIAPLLGQLGYPATEAQVAERLARVSADGSRRIVVAEADGHLVGLAVLEIAPALNRSEPVARLALLVVDEHSRGRGVGRELVRDFEAWARCGGARHASLTSALHRDGAHGFYRSCGWEATGLRFARELPGEPLSEV